MSNIIQKGFTIIGALSIAISSFSQNSYTMEQSVAYALENAPSIKNANLEYDIARAKVKETTALGLPQINGKWDLMYNLAVQQQFFPNEPGPFYNPTIPEGESFPVQFGTSYSSNANATLTQLLFDGSYLIGLKAAKVYTELSEVGITKNKEDVVLNVQKAYYMVLVTKKRITQIEESKTVLEKLMNDTKILADNGFAEQVDAKRVAVNLNNLNAEFQKLNSFLEMSTNMLKFQMGMPIPESISLADELDSKVSEMTKSTSTNNIEARSEFKMIEVQNELNELNLQNEKINLLPSLAAFGTLGVNYGSNDFGSVFGFGDYQDYSMIGLSLNVPIWSSGQRKFRIDQAKAESEKTVNNMEMLKNSIALESSMATNSLNNSIEVLKVREENITLATEVFDNSKIKYKEGVGSSFEVTSAQNDLKTAQTEYYNALYEAIIAKIDLDKANGSLNIGN